MATTMLDGFPVPWDIERPSIHGFLAGFALKEGEGLPPAAETYVFGDANGDLAVSCADISPASAPVRKRAGQAAFSVGADIDQNGVIDVRDILGMSRLLPARTRC